MSIFGPDYNTIQRRERLLQFQPRESAPTGRIRAGRVLNHQAFVASGTRGLKGAINLLSRICLSNARQTQAIRHWRKRFQCPSSLAKRPIQIAAASQPQQIERDEFNRHFFPHKKIRFLAAKPFLEIGKRQNLILAHRNHFSIQDEVPVRSVYGIG